MLCDLPTEKQNQVIGRIWSTIGIDAGSITDELLVEWREELADLNRDQINRGIHHWKTMGRTCPADEFADSCKPKRAARPVVDQELKIMNRIVSSGFTESRDEACRALGIPVEPKSQELPL